MLQVTMLMHRAGYRLDMEIILKKYVFFCIYLKYDLKIENL